MIHFKNQAHSDRNSEKKKKYRTAGDKKSHSVYRVREEIGRMLRLLAARECGFDPPWLLPRLYQHQRYSQVELSSDKEFARGHKSGVASVDIDRQAGRYVISGGRDKEGTILIHDLCSPVKSDIATSRAANASCPIVATVTTPDTAPRPAQYHHHHSPSHSISVVQWYPHDTGLFTSSSTDHTLKVWDTNTLDVVEKFSFSKIIYTHSMAESESHSLIAVGGGDCQVMLCDMTSGSTSHILRCHTGPVFSLAWSPLREYCLASGGQDNSIVLWDVRMASGPLKCLDQHNGSGASNTATVVTAHNGCVNGLTFTSDGLFLVSFGTDNAIRLWNSGTGKNTLINYGLVHNTLQKQTVQLYCTSHTTSLQPLGVVPSGGELVMLELMTGKKLKSLSGHYGAVNCVVGHHVEQEFYSGGNDRNILYWSPPSPAAPDQPKARRRGRATPHSSMMGVYEDTWSSDED